MHRNLGLLLLAGVATGCMRSDEPLARSEPLPTSCPASLRGVDIDLASTPRGYEIILATDDTRRLDTLERQGPQLLRDFARAYDLEGTYSVEVTRVLEDDAFEIDLPDWNLLAPGATDERLIPEGVLLVITPRQSRDLATIRQLGHSFADHLEDHCGADV